MCISGQREREREKGVEDREGAGRRRGESYRRKDGKGGSPF